MVFAIICFAIVGLIILNAIVRMNAESKIDAQYEQAKEEVKKNPFDEKAFERFLTCGRIKYRTKFRKSNPAEMSLAIDKFLKNDVAYVYALRNELLKKRG